MGFLSKIGSSMAGFGVVVTLGASALAAGPASASTPHLAGEPQWKTGDVTGVWVWSDAAGDHLRFRAKAGETHAITANICAKDIKVTKRVDLEAGDTADFVKATSCIVVNLKSDETPDGIDFKGEGKTVSMAFEQDGKPMAVDRIFIGQAATNPGSARFALSIKNDR